MTSTLPPEDDFDDLDADLAEAIQAREARLHHAKLLKSASKGASISLQAELEFYTWRTVSATALFQRQRCTFCGSEHKWFLGWMAEQEHIYGHHARRFVRGKPIEEIHERTETIDYGTVPACAFCISSQLKEPFDAKRLSEARGTPAPISNQAGSGPSVPSPAGDQRTEPDVEAAIPAGGEWVAGLA